LRESILAGVEMSQGGLKLSIESVVVCGLALARCQRRGQRRGQKQNHCRPAQKEHGLSILASLLARFETRSWKLEIANELRASNHRARKRIADWS